MSRPAVDGMGIRAARCCPVRLGSFRCGAGCRASWLLLVSCRFFVGLGSQGLVMFLADVVRACEYRLGCGKHRRIDCGCLARGAAGGVPLFAWLHLVGFVGLKLETVVRLLVW